MVHREAVYNQGEKIMHFSERQCHGKRPLTFGKVRFCASVSPSRA